MAEERVITEEAVLDQLDKIIAELHHMQVQGTTGAQVRTSVETLRLHLLAIAQILRGSDDEEPPLDDEADDDSE